MTTGYMYYMYKMDLYKTMPMVGLYTNDIHMHNSLYSKLLCCKKKVF